MCKRPTTYQCDNNENPDIYEPGKPHSYTSSEGVRSFCDEYFVCRSSGDKLYYSVNDICQVTLVCRNGNCFETADGSDFGNRNRCCRDKQGCHRPFYSATTSRRWCSAASSPTAVWRARCAPR